MYLNYSRKSTAGWSIFNIMCDFTGGSFSILQQVVDMTHTGMTTGDYSFFGSSSDAFNVVKFMLGVLSIVFDVIFMVQHFVLYRAPSEKLYGNSDIELKAKLIDHNEDNSVENKSQ